MFTNERLDFVILTLVSTSTKSEARTLIARVEMRRLVGNAGIDVILFIFCPCVSSASLPYHNTVGRCQLCLVMVSAGLAASGPAGGILILWRGSVSRECVSLVMEVKTHLPNEI